MDTNATQKEILLAINTNFSRRLFCSRDEESAKEAAYTNDERLEAACWNGLLNELLPEVMEPFDNNTLFLWRCAKLSSCIELEFGEQPPNIDPALSLDPYLVINAQVLN